MCVGNFRFITVPSFFFLSFLFCIITSLSAFPFSRLGVQPKNFKISKKRIQKMIRRRSAVTLSFFRKFLCTSSRRFLCTSSSATPRPKKMSVLKLKVVGAKYVFRRRLRILRFEKYTHTHTHTHTHNPTHTGNYHVRQRSIEV